MGRKTKKEVELLKNVESSIDPIKLRRVLCNAFEKLLPYNHGLFKEEFEEIHNLISKLVDEALEKGQNNKISEFEKIEIYQYAKREVEKRVLILLFRSIVEDSEEAEILLKAKYCIFFLYNLTTKNIEKWKNYGEKYND